MLLARASHRSLSHSRGGDDTRAQIPEGGAYEDHLGVCVTGDNEKSTGECLHNIEVGYDFPNRTQKALSTVGKKKIKINHTTLRISTHQKNTIKRKKREATKREETFKI